MSQFLVRYLLRFDGLAGLAAGVNTLLIHTWLASLYGLPTSVLLLNALANLAYGTFSSTLATLPKRPLSLIKTLSIANCMWAVVCFAFAFNLPSTATVFAAGHAVFEGLFVGSLGIIEWRYRHQLQEKAL